MGEYSGRRMGLRPSNEIRVLDLSGSVVDNRHTKVKASRIGTYYAVTAVGRIR
jgi:hypothetical protein